MTTEERNALNRIFQELAEMKSLLSASPTPPNSKTKSERDAEALARLEGRK